MTYEKTKIIAKDCSFKENFRHGPKQLLVNSFHKYFYIIAYLEQAD